MDKPQTGTQVVGDGGGQARSSVAPSDIAHLVGLPHFGDGWDGFSSGEAFPQPLPADVPQPPMPGDTPSTVTSVASQSEPAGTLLTDDLLQPMGLEPASSQPKDTGGAGAFLRQVVLGGGEEQKPDTGLGTSLN